MLFCPCVNCLTGLMRQSMFYIKWKKDRKKEVTSHSHPQPSPWPCQSVASLSSTLPSIHPSPPPDFGPAPALNKDLMLPNHLSGRSDQSCNTQQQVPRMRPQPDTEVLKNNSRKKQHNPTITVITLSALSRSCSHTQSALANENLMFTIWESTWRDAGSLSGHLCLLLSGSFTKYQPVVSNPLTICWCCWQEISGLHAKPLPKAFIQWLLMGGNV